MKKWIITITCCSIMFLALTACSQQDNAQSEVQNQETLLKQEEAINIAKEELTKEEKESITNFENPVVEEMSFTKEPNIYKYDNTESMIDKQVYKITFHTKQDNLLGPIVFYIDVIDGQIYGMDYRE